MTPFLLMVGTTLHEATGMCPGQPIHLILEPIHCHLQARGSVLRQLS